MYVLYGSEFSNETVGMREYLICWRRERLFLLKYLYEANLSANKMREIKLTQQQIRSSSKLGSTSKIKAGKSGGGAV